MRTQLNAGGEGFAARLTILLVREQCDAINLAELGGGGCTSEQAWRSQFNLATIPVSHYACAG